MIGIMKDNSGAGRCLDKQVLWCLLLAQVIIILYFKCNTQYNAPTQNFYGSAPNAPTLPTPLEKHAHPLLNNDIAMT